MNTWYLDSLPEVENKYNVQLEAKEKVVLAVKLEMLGTEKGRMIGSDCNFTITNQRMVIDNHAGVWTINIAEDMAGCNKVKGGFLMFKYSYFAVRLNHTIVFDYEKQKLNGFQFYFGKEEEAQFEQIIKNLFD